MPQTGRFGKAIRLGKPKTSLRGCSREKPRARHPRRSAGASGVRAGPPCRPLLKAAQSPGIWNWMSPDLSDPAIMVQWVDQALSSERMGEEYAFTVMNARTGEIVGISRYLNIYSRDRGVEIGWTWCSPKV